jgi:hypothetical protein
MTAFGPAGLAIFVFIGATLALTGVYGLELLIKRSALFGR